MSIPTGEHTVGAIDYGPTDSEDSTSNSVILDLQASDLVWLELVEGRELYSSNYRFTTFSGFLLFENWKDVFLIIIHTLMKLRSENILLYF